MGRMSFPENEDRPSRTIVANQFPRSREAILYKSEWGRRGDGEYRGPTLREAASLMSFPITYQFFGKEKQKWMLVGNAVCPLVSFALAVQLLRSLGKRVRVQPRKHVTRSLGTLANLNRFQPKVYDSAPLRRKAARFRSNASKAQSMTVTLTNYDIRKASGQQRIWRCFVTYGIGDGYKVQAIKLDRIAEIQAAIRQQSSRGAEYIGRITNGFSERIPTAGVLQELYEANRSRRGAFFAPSRLLSEAKRIISEFADADESIQPSVRLFRKDKVPAQHLYALFAVCRIAQLAAKKELQ
jgi:DNA (cytosine-5)-methyltransferase 1